MYIRAIYDADESSQIADLRPQNEDLDTLNSYTSPYAHDSGSSPPINDRELQAMVWLTLKVIGRA